MGMKTNRKISIKNNYNMTLYACYFGYITQAIVNNFAPLLFLTFQREYEISLDKIAMLVSFNFGVQLLVDFLAARYVDKIGYRISMVAAHLFAAAGLMGIGVFPEIFTEPFWGLLLAVAFYAIGGGLIEVLVSPIVEACPTEKKEAAMSLLHSFYCWGHMGVILISTLFFVTVGIKQWKYLACIWAVVPFVNAFLFGRVPIRVLVEEDKQMSVGQLFRSRIFWVLVVLMVCSGASEHGMSQWASAFAESGLHVSKTVGDIFGPCFFALMMGVSRIFYSKASEKVDLKKFMIFSSLLCIVSYLIASRSPSAALSLLGCGLCGLSVGIMWPGSFSIAAKSCPGGGTSMFAFLALAGDLGCATGPFVVGRAAQYFGGNLKTGLLTVIIFPMILMGGILKIRKSTD